MTKLPTSLSIAGRVESGKGLGASFLRLDWARRIFLDGYGIDPFPGTLNLRVEQGQAVEAWRRAVGRGRLFEAPAPDACDARCIAAVIRHGDRQADGVIVVPLVAAYPEDQVELVAAVRLREFLGVADGDAVTLDIPI